ncbi:sacsin N-terminal ATP-binding-like domain-containing protein [Cellulomonas sp. NPDC055163]
MSPDAFGTAALRAAVLEAWRASPARLREDANTEEDHARGYYRDRVLVELAQNAADAATRAGVPGRLLLRLASTSEGSVLIAANTGAPLDEAGVASLASMRASAKREGYVAPAQPFGRGPAVVGRFGVGFAAVRAVADEVSVLSTTGGVRFSLADTVSLLAEASADVPGLADEVRRRDGSLPALRLPLPAEGAPPTGYDTAVVLELRDEVAADEVRALLAAVGDPLLLALPGLVEVLVEDDAAPRPVRRVADLHERWHVASAHGELDLALLADRPVEERTARGWRVTWAVPRAASRTVRVDALGPAGDAPPAVPWTPVVHAPTPTDEPCTLPALLVATLPLDPSRRHVAPGPLTDAVLAHAAHAYAVLASAAVERGDDPLALVPTGLPAGSLDGTLRGLVVERLTRTPLLRSGGAGIAVAGTDGEPGGDPRDEGDGDRHGEGDRRDEGDGDRDDVARAGLVEPGRAVAVEGEVGRDAVAVQALAVHARGLVLLRPGSEAAARTLGVELRPLADVVEELPAVRGAEPGEWRALYAALDGAAHDPATREALGALPVPLADGRVVRGARGLVLLRDAERGADVRDDAGTGADVRDDTRRGADVLDALGVLGRWGLRVVHPDAEHPLLARLGATTPDAAGLLAHPAVRQAVLDQADDDDLALASDVTQAVLALVSAAVAERGDASPETGPLATVASWLGLLTLPAADGEPTPAHGLVVPGSAAAGLLDDRVLAPVQAELVERWGADVLVAAGVRADLVVVHVGDVVAGAVDLGSSEADALAAGSLDAWEDYAEELAEAFGGGAYVPDVRAVADLDAVAPGQWPAVLARLAERPDLRVALLDPVRAEGVTAGSAPSYTAWWLRERADLGLGRPFAVRGARDDALTRLLPAAPEVLAGVDPEVQRALGGVGSLDGLDPGAWRHVLDGLGAPGAPVDLKVAAGLWRTWAALAGGAAERGPGDEVELVPALVGPTRIAVVHADDAAVADSPMWWQRTDLAALVPAPAAAPARTSGPDSGDTDDERPPAAALAALLGLPLASDLGDGVVDREPDGARAADHPGASDGAGAGGEVVPTPEAVLRLLPDAPATWVEHDELRVDGVPVDWWVEGAGTGAVVHATQLAALARGMAQATGRWGHRHAVEIVLTGPGRAEEIAVEQAADPAT